jgi:hypothetical protein
MRTNPFLPSWEYVPDGEPHVFGDRVYLYGSHDRFNGHAFCLNDYVCWSAPVDDVTDWRYEGVIYGRGDDPRNADGDQCLYAPDVARGPDGRYYLFYVLDASPFVSVAVCDTPAGRYRFYGHVHYPDGSLLGERGGDAPMFDPGVLVEGDRAYIYGGFCPNDAPEREGAMVSVLEADMLTVARGPRTVVPSFSHSAGTGFEGHEYYEAASIRKVGETYYFIYSSVLHHELCYATSASPVEGFAYRGAVVSNVDVGIGRYKPASRMMACPDNNHGSIERIGGKWFVFYHRHTNGHCFSRQACMEPIRLLPDGAIPQAEITSCGPNGGPLPGEGVWSAHIACNLFCDAEYAEIPGVPGKRLDARFPCITQDGRDGDEVHGHIANMDPGATAGFKFFDCRGSALTAVTTRGWCWGAFEVLTAPDGEVLGSIPVGKSNDWRRWPGRVPIPDGVQALYLRFSGDGCASLYEFELSICK